MNLAILHHEVQEFINRNLAEDITRILLKKSPFQDVTPKELVGQIESKKKSGKKLPTWYNTPGIYYPPKIAIEQASSELTADYKAGLVKGNKVIDVTGGFGVDSVYLSKSADKVIHCEVNPELSAIAAYNASVLGINNIRFVQQDGITFLQEASASFDTIYIDPSRRVNAQKVFKLADCEPDVVSKLSILMQKSQRILIKTSPLLDIQAGLNELSGVNAIHILSVKNDCKELLWILDKEAPGNVPQITCATLDPLNEYRFSPGEERNFRITSYSSPLQYIYEPDVSLLKGGCFKLLTRDFTIQKLHKNTHLYTSDTIRPDFIGRTFRLKRSWLYKDFLSAAPVSHANVICRNFPLSVEEVKRKSNLKDGGPEYLLCCTGPADELLVLSCERL